jgi:CHAT domain-containing protein/predicted negative regulator of RcsB-dependent stress response
MSKLRVFALEELAVIRKYAGPLLFWGCISLAAFWQAWQWLGEGPLALPLAALLGLVGFGFFAGLAIYLGRNDIPDVRLPPLSQRRGLGKATWWILSLVGVITAQTAWAIQDFAVDGQALLISLGAGAAGWLLFGLGVFVKGAEIDEKIAMQELQKADTLRQKADRLFAQGSMVEAITGYEAVLLVQRRYRPAQHGEIIGALLNLARASLRLKRYRDALGYAQEARPLSASLAGRSSGAEVPIIVAGNERLLGEAHMGLKDYAAARLHFAAAATLWQELLLKREDIIKAAGGDENPLFALINLVALADARAGDMAAAIEQEAAALALQTTLARSSASDPAALAEISDHARLKGFAHMESAPAKSVGFMQEALACAQTADDAAAVAGAHASLGLAWESLGSVDLARHHYDQALALTEGTHGPDSAECGWPLRLLGDLAATLGDHQASRQRYERALICARAGSSETDLAWGGLGLAEAMLNSGDYANPPALVREVLRLDATSEDGFLRARTYSALSALHAHKAAPDVAILLGKRAVNELQSALRRLGDLEQPVRHRYGFIYRRLAELLVDAGRLPEAQRVLDLLKEEEFDEFVTRKAGSEAPPVLRLTEREVSWTRHGDAIETTIATLSSERRSLIEKPDRSVAEADRLEALHILLDQAKQDLDTWLDTLADALRAERPAAQEQVRALNLDLLETLRGDLAELGPGVALVHFILGAQRLAIILTKPDLQISRDVAILDVEMHTLVHRFRRVLRSPGRDMTDLLRLAKALHDHLIAPIAEHLGDVETLMVVLDGALRYLPLAALHDGTRFLIERHGLAVLTPASYTRLKDRPLDWMIGGIGGLGVSQRSGEHAPLAAVGDELRAIIREGDETDGIFPGKRYLDAAFTPTALAEALQAHKAIHIASHFDFAVADDKASALLLGDGSELTLQQLQADRYVFRNIELVTLSACETALGSEPVEAVALQGLRRMNGREFESLAATIQKRGAKAVIASLWAVEDNSTAILMRLFYQARRDGLTKAAALRRAQTALLRQMGASGTYAHPYFWAPFILMGNWQ